MDYNSKYKSSEIEEILDSVGGKQDKENGKGLSTEDFTTALKTKLEGLSNYDDTELSDALSTLRGDFDKLVSGDTTTAIKTFNEVIAFLDGIADSEDLNSIIASIEQQIANKANADSLAKVATSGSYTDLKNQPTIPSAVTESTVSGWGFTKNTGTITGVSANGTSVATSGVANIPAATTGKYGVTKLSSATNSTSTTLAATPSAVKSAYDLANGKYLKPSTGIPFGDFEEQVQGSIIKAEESVQGVSMGVTTGNATAGNFFNVNKDANGNVSIQMIQNTLASGKIAIPYTTDVKQYIDNAVANAGGGGGTGGSGIPAYREINHGTNETTITIMPNEFHVWDEVSDLTLAFEQEMPGYASEYLFQFISGATPTTLTLPNDIKFSEDLAIEANKTYQISILKGLGSVLSWDNVALIENKATITLSGNKATVNLQYAAASSLSVRITHADGANIITIPAGEISGSANIMSPMVSNLKIDYITPEFDTTYIYVK